MLTDLRLRVIDKINKKTQFKGLEEEHEIDIDKVKYEIVEIINIKSFLYFKNFHCNFQYLSLILKMCKYFEIMDRYVTTPNLRFISFTLMERCDNIIVETRE